MSLYFNRFVVRRQFVFVPWEVEDITLDESITQPPWLVDEPKRFLYCHEMKETRNVCVYRFTHISCHVALHHKLAHTNFRISNDDVGYLNTETYRRSLTCHILFVDPWSVLCDVVGSNIPKKKLCLCAQHFDFLLNRLLVDTVSQNMKKFFTRIWR